MEVVKQQIADNNFVIGEINDEKKLKENMKMNCVPESILSMTTSNYDESLEKKRRLMIEKILRFYKNL